MESSRRAVQSYWRWRMIDGATSGEDKVTPVYKLEEICELLRSSHAGIVKEVSEFILKRLDNKSPIVKQKALRVIKYAVGESGAEFRREMQRHSVAVRQLIHYKGHPDPLKGDALNKAVRETAQEALSAIFSNEESKPTPAVHLSRRIQGFGGTKSEPALEEKKSFLSEVVGIGSASIKQGLSTLTQGNSHKTNGSGNYGSYKGPTLRRSLTNEMEHMAKYEKMEYHGGDIGISGSSKNLSAELLGQDSKLNRVQANSGDPSPSSSYVESKTREERLLETIVTSGGVRLQPTRDALQAFLVEASKMDAVALSLALESKIQSPIWQVRMKAVCVLEAILRKRDDEHLLVVESFFKENIDIMLQCSESPQASLRERANKILSLLGGSGAMGCQPAKPGKAEQTEKSEMPDLIDTGDPDDLLRGDDPLKSLSDQNITNQSTTAAPLIDDLFGDAPSNVVGTGKEKTNDDPFSGVSFHISEDKEQESDLFAGLIVGSGGSDRDNVAEVTGLDPFDIFGSGSNIPPNQDNIKNHVDNLMSGFSISDSSSSVNGKAGFSSELSGTASNDEAEIQALKDCIHGGLDTKMAAMAANRVFPMDSIPYNKTPDVMFDPSHLLQPLHYSAVGGFLTQQQFVAAMANLQQLQHLGSMNSKNVEASFGSRTDAGYSSALPDIFNANMPNQTSTAIMNNSRKEDTKAFDFISDHLAAARDPKRVI